MRPSTLIGILDPVWALDFDCAAAFHLLHLENKALKRDGDDEAGWVDPAASKPLTRKWSKKISAETLSNDPGILVRLMQPG